MATDITNDTLDCTTEYELGDYELNLRIGAVFILLVISFIGVATPSLVKHKNWKIVHQILYVGKFFGAGVITATGFVHIFPDAVATLADPCLPEFFQDYSASAGLIALMAALFTHLIDFLAQAYTYNQAKKQATSSETTPKTPTKHSHLIGATDDSRNNDAAVYILEAGIAIHSIIIGVDLGLNIEEFHSLLIALTFHQFFEGIGLGYKLAELSSSSKKYKSLINSMIYACTTPLGVVIGIVSHIYSASTNYSMGTTAKGVTDSMAAGILIYVSLVNMVFEEYCSESFHELPFQQKLINFGSLYLGAGIMSLIGLWA